MTSIDMQCKYAYKECYNERTLKRDGGVHRLCEHHRSKANALQKVYATKRRRELRAQKRNVLNTKLGAIEPLPFAPLPPPAVPAPCVKMDPNDVFICQDLVFLFDDYEMDLIDSQSDVEKLSDDELAYLFGVL